MHPSILGVVASIEVAEATRIILGKEPQLASKLLYCDIGSMNFDKITLSHRNACPVCGKEPVQDFSLKRKLIEEVCGRDGKRTFIITPRENLRLNISELYNQLNKKHQIRMKADLGITFTQNSEVILSILQSGVMITEGNNDANEALKLYEETIIDGFSIPWKRIK